MAEILTTIFNFIAENLIGYIGNISIGIPIPGYFFWSLFLYILFYIFLAKKLISRKNVVSKHKGLDIVQTRRELIFSISSVIVFGLTDLVIYTIIGNYFKNYTEVGGIIDWAWFLISVPLLFVLHDTWFYWTHRAMHHPKIFRHVHKLHHLSRETTPFTAISFYPLEAIVEGSWYVIPALLFPFHPIAILLFAIIQTFHTVFNHLGYEPFPKGFTRHPILGIKTTPTHHSMHHEKVGGNYGLYFTWWDRMMGTEFKDYHETFEKLTN